MTSRDFCYWLQGYFEITEELKDGRGIGAGQAEMIRRHLSLVFKHEIDPSIPDPTGELQAIHDGKPPFQGKPPFNGDIVGRC